MAKPKKTDLQTALNRTIEFIRSIYESEAVSESSEHEVMFNNIEFGGLRMSGDEVKSYKEVLKLLLSALPNRDHVSARTVEKWLQTSMLSAIKPKEFLQRGRDSVEFERNLSTAIQQLGSNLKQKPQDYEVFYPVRGLLPDDLPKTWGGVEFFVFTKEVLNRFFLGWQSQLD